MDQNISMHQISSKYLANDLAWIGLEYIYEQASDERTGQALENLNIFLQATSGIGYKKCGVYITYI